MFFKQLVKEDLGCASYIVGCTNAGVCAVIDPRLDMVDDILALASAKEMRLTTIIETHNHADHISGHAELVRRTGARICVHEMAQAEYPHQDLHDGDELQLGVVNVRVIHTPGHRPEHIALAVSDTSRSTDPWLVLTGDSLFIGDVARPDLAVSGVEGADALYSSIFDRLLQLEDGVEVYPAHVAGSLCGRGMNAKTSSTIGFERKHNPAITPRPRATFIADMNENLPQRPPNMLNIVERNRGDYRHQPAPTVPPPLNPPEFQFAMTHPATLVIDTRSPHQFGEGHIAGALHVYLRGSAFPTRVGFVAAPTNRLLLVVEDQQDLHEAVTQLAVVGFDQVIGYLEGGMPAWQEAGLPQQQLPQLTVHEVHSMMNAYGRDLSRPLHIPDVNTNEAPAYGRDLSRPDLSRPDLSRPHILDVRDQSEWDEGHIPGAIHIPYYFIEQRLLEHQLDPAQPLAVMCASGQRSTIACSILQRHGFCNLSNVVGGLDAWEKAGFERA